jgi:insulysin
MEQVKVAEVSGITEPIKSEKDYRLYRAFVLPNALEVLLISDPTADKAAAAIDVLVGHYQDPDDIPGLAHFCEHMLFLGTKKYPDENSYSSFLSSHGGKSNAYTSGENTNYYFEVGHEFLEEALDRFAQFFICPLFTPDATEREMNAVDSENAKNLQSDEWRLLQLQKCSANPAHPYHKFGTGNLHTLRDIPAQKGIDVRQALLAFHSKYYSANVIKLAVLGRESLDVLQAWVASKFHEVPNLQRQVRLTNPDIVPFRKAELTLRYSIVPVKDLRNLALYWPLPSMKDHYLKKPTHYVSHLIGHESEGSLLSLLKKKGWGYELVAGAVRPGSDFEVFKVTIKLTEEGFDHIDDIITHTFEYIEMLRAAKVQEWIFREIALIDAIDFRFKEKEGASSYVSNLASNMHWYPPHHFLSGPYLVSEFDPALIEQVLQLLNPYNLRVHVVSKKFEGQTNEEEQWYKTQFKKEAIDSKLLEAWARPLANPHLHLPPVNEFIPTALDIKPQPDAEEEYPRLILQEAGLSVWHKQDRKFLFPKADLRFVIVTPTAYDSPRHAVAALLYMHLLNDSLNEYAYLADIAGLKFKLATSPRGIAFHVHGYDQKLAVLLEKLLGRLIALPIAQDRYLMFKEKTLRDYQNMKKNQPWEHARIELEYHQWSQIWDTDEKIQALQELEMSDLETLPKWLLGEALVEAQVVGNITAAEARELSLKIPGILKYRPLPLSRVPERRIVQLPVGHHFVVQKPEPNPDNNNSAIYHYYQVGPDDVEVEVQLQTIAQIAHEPAFDILRTKQQLGYLVWSDVRNYYGICGYRFIIQSSVKDPDYIHERIEEFIVELRQIIAGMSDTQFEDHKNGLIVRLEEKDKSLQHEAAYYWEEVSSHKYMFDRRLALARLIRQTVTKATVLQFFDRYLLKGGSHRAVLSLRIYGNQHPCPAPPPTSTQGQSELKSQTPELEKVVYVREPAPAFRRRMPLWAENT